VTESYDAKKWKLITGSIDYLESAETPLEAAIRECKEEVGIDLKKENAPVQFAGFAWTGNFRGNIPDVNFVFASQLPGESRLTPQEGEIAQAGWLLVKALIQEDSVLGRSVTAARQAIQSGWNGTTAHWSWDVHRTKPVLMYTPPKPSVEEHKGSHF